MAKKAPQPLADSSRAYDDLKVITDAAQNGSLRPWSPVVVKLLNAYGVVVDRKRGSKVEATLSFPTSKLNSMAIGIRHMKDEESYAEDLFLFEKDVGLTPLYRGKQETLLPEYVGTHHGKPAIALQEALPDIQKEIDSIKQAVSLQSILSGINTENIMTPAEFKAELEQQGVDAKRTVDNLVRAHPGVMREQVSAAVHAETQKRYTAARTKWFASERLYEAKKTQVELLYPDPIDAAPHLETLNKLFGK
jgi:hypothetical protein